MTMEHQSRHHQIADNEILTTISRNSSHKTFQIPVPDITQMSYQIFTSIQASFNSPSVQSVLMSCPSLQTFQRVVPSILSAMSYQTFTSFVICPDTMSLKILALNPFKLDYRAGSYSYHIYMNFHDVSFLPIVTGFCRSQGGRIARTLLAIATFTQNFSKSCIMTSVLEKFANLHVLSSPQLFCIYPFFTDSRIVNLSKERTMTEIQSYQIFTTLLERKSKQHKINV